MCSGARTISWRPSTAANSSGASQMWNLKSGAWRRSSSRMSVQVVSSCSGTGGRGPPQGLQRRWLLQGGTGGELPDCPRREQHTATFCGPTGVPECLLANRGKSRERPGAVVDRTVDGGLIPSATPPPDGYPDRQLFFASRKHPG